MTDSRKFVYDGWTLVAEANGTNNAPEPIGGGLHAILLNLTDYRLISPILFHSFTGLTFGVVTGKLCPVFEKDVTDMKQMIRFAVLAFALSFLVAGNALAATKRAPVPPAASGTHRATMARNPYLGAIAVDAASGRVLFEDRADTKGYPASMQKLMDLLIILEKLERKELSLDMQVPVSAKAAKTGGSQVWLAEKESFSLDDMLYALMVQSANDAAVAIAEKVAGSTEAFVELMNAKARQLGMASTAFHSVHGLPPAAGQEHDVTTPRDFSILCRELLKHPEALKYTSTRERTFRPNQGKKTVVMRTHNHLLSQVEGCDGLKTGYFAQAGFSIAVTASRNGQRVVVVVLDSPDLKTRDAKAKELVAKGFAALATSAAAPAPSDSTARKR